MDKQENIKGTIDADWLGTEVAGLIYRQGKAQIFNVLETQFENPNDLKLRAAKRLVENILDNIGRDAKRLIVDTLGDWKEEVEIEPDSILAGKEFEEAKKDWEENEGRF